MADQTWSTFRRKIYINAPSGKIYWHWATSKGMETWFLRSCEYTDHREVKRAREEHTQAGDTYLWYWHNWPDGESGIINEANGRTHLAFSFSGAQVTIDLEESKGTTLVTLTQHHIPTDDRSKMNVYYGCGTGWTFWLANLKAYLEHGVLLHHTEPDMMGRGDFSDFVNL
ncbi:MAG: SRPBCC domain-containing protein [Marinoscillum sp.]|uniref:SRPBCC family protein n=1 Tax=Marinoscillum sp. TaxID=2024838 RepID=UPI0032F18804